MRAGGGCPGGGPGAAPGVGIGRGGECGDGTAQGGEGEEDVVGGDVGPDRALVAASLQQVVHGPPIVLVHVLKDVDAPHVRGHEVVRAPVGRQRVEDRPEVFVQPGPGVRRVADPVPDGHRAGELVVEDGLDEGGAAREVPVERRVPHPARRAITSSGASRPCSVNTSWAAATSSSRFRCASRRRGDGVARPAPTVILILRDKRGLHPGADAPMLSSSQKTGSTPHISVPLRDTAREVRRGRRYGTGTRRRRPGRLGVDERGAHAASRTPVSTSTGRTSSSAPRRARSSAPGWRPARHRARSTSASSSAPTGSP